MNTLESATFQRGASRQIENLNKAARKQIQQLRRKMQQLVEASRAFHAKHIAMVSRDHRIFLGRNVCANKKKYKNENSSKTPEKLLKPPYIIENLFKTPPGDPRT